MCGGVGGGSDFYVDTNPPSEFVCVCEGTPTKFGLFQGPTCHFVFLLFFVWGGVQVLPTFFPAELSRPEVGDVKRTTRPMSSPRFGLRGLRAALRRAAVPQQLGQGPPGEPRRGGRGLVGGGWGWLAGWGVGGKLGKPVAALPPLSRSLLFLLSGLIRVEVCSSSCLGFQHLFRPMFSSFPFSGLICGLACWTRLVSFFFRATRQACFVRAARRLDVAFLAPMVSSLPLEQIAAAQGEGWGEERAVRRCRPTGRVLGSRSEGETSHAGGT